MGYRYSCHLEYEMIVTASGHSFSPGLKSQGHRSLHKIGQINVNMYDIAAP